MAKYSMTFTIRRWLLILYAIGLITFLVHVFFAKQLGLEPLVDFQKMHDWKNMQEEEIFSFLLNDFIKYIIVFLGVFMLGGILKILLDTAALSSCSSWIKRRGIDCYPILKNGRGSGEKINWIGSAFLISKRPRAKTIFYGEFLAQIVIDVSIIQLLKGLWESFLWMSWNDTMAEFGESIKKVLTSPDAIMMYICFALSFALHFITNKLVDWQKEKLFSSLRLEETDA